MTGGELGRSWKSFGGDRGECVAKGTPRATKPGGGGVGSGREVMAGTTVDEGDEQAPAVVF